MNTVHQDGDHAAPGHTTSKPPPTAPVDGSLHAGTDGADGGDPARGGAHESLMLPEGAEPRSRRVVS